jgi:hypothetical protein
MKTKARLKLGKETIRLLTKEETKQAAGGLTFTDTRVAGGCTITARTCYWSDCRVCF